MKFRKMITVSAAALMLAGVGASTTNVGSSVHASRRTVRISNLRSKSTRLSHQIKSDKLQVKSINREIARLNRKTVRKGKRSKKNVKRHKRAKKVNRKQVRRSRQDRKQIQNNKKLTPKQKQQQQIMEKYVAASKKRIPVHIQMNGEVYNAKVNGLNQIVSKKPYMSLKSYNAKNRKALAQDKRVMNRLSNKFKKLHSQKSKMKFLQTKAVKRAVKQSQKVNVLSVQSPKAQNAKK